jgi:phosphonopyruvate decarboxylase
MVCVLDGDGAALMHLGAFAVIAEHRPPNLLHVLFDNHAHESVGGQPTPSDRLDFPALALAAGYRRAERVRTIGELRDALPGLVAAEGPSFFEIEIRVGSRGDLGRPVEPPSHNRDAFMSWLRE